MLTCFQETNYLKNGGDKYDLLKTILSILIVLLHTRPLPALFEPILRIAVPIFFIVSSFFFFNKINGQSWSFSVQQLRRFIKRNLQLYAFWFIILLPITLIRHTWFDHGYYIGVIRIIRSFLLGSTFAASWFIMALIIAISLVTIASKFIDMKLIFAISVLFYLFCSFDSNYHNLLCQSDVFRSFFTYYHNHIGVPYISFPVALVWVVFGKILSEHQVKIHYSILIIFLIIGFTVLFFEHSLVHYRCWAIDNDCYLSLLLVCPLSFITISQLDISLHNARVFRKISTIIYCSHLSVLTVLELFLAHNDIVSDRWSLFFLCLITSGVIAIGLLLLEKRFPIFRFSH